MMVSILSGVLISLFTLHSYAATIPANSDFIVVGGGTAGLAVASRLSRSLPNSKILVIEAGPAAYDEAGINIPGLKGSTLFGKYDWSFLSTPQPGANNRVFGQSRGKVLGGSSALNFMVWDRASKPEYDAWEELGNPGWGWSNMIKAMLKVENFLPDPRYNGKGVAKGGPIQSLINRFVPKQQSAFIPTMMNLGLDTNTDSLNGYPLGVMFQPNNIRESNYTRSYSVEYLNIAGPNLQILTETQVQKINLVKSKGKWVATGVTLSDGSVITASKEVILSAGTMQSPTILEASGIGNNSILAAAGIQTKISLPSVGENLQDHMFVSAAYRLKPGYTSFDTLLKNSTYAGEQMALYMQNKLSQFDYDGSGYAFANWQQVLGSDAAMIASALKSASSSPVDELKLEYLTIPSVSEDVPQVEVIFADGYTGTKGYPDVNSTLYGAQFITLLGVVQHTFSTGSVHIDPKTPSGSPVINPNYLSNQYDLKAVVEIAKYLRKIASTKPLKDILVDEYEPGLSTSTNDQWTEYVKNTAATIWHPTGTCAMMPRYSGGVVNDKLIVYETTNLRVVDASIIPIQISAHVQTAVYGIAERAAEFIASKYA